MSTHRARVLELAVLGHLAAAPMHGYELRKRLDCELGPFRTFSFGSLYPCLKEMLRAGYVSAAAGGRAPSGSRPRIVYRLTGDGTERLHRLLADSAPAADDDECFGVHFTLLGRVPPEVRLRVLAARRTRLLERLACLRERLAGSPGPLDPYVHEFNRHRAEALENEIGWLEALIRRGTPLSGRAAAGTAPGPPHRPADRPPAPPARNGR
ncbi:PadR family transcriptional regulator [Nocardiopsis sediminis]|uniref:PadR family transcriptional regulator n=1 Tax=Nocardiopsis sediminis TaxID=1778267 RepID=A0ABV8FTC4_9ACTN